MQEADPSHVVSHWKPTSSTTSIRVHFSEYHLEEWVTSCDQLKIPITAQTVQRKIRKFRNLPEPSEQESTRVPYSKEAFENALVDLIVGDDLVGHRLLQYNRVLIKIRP
jgi:hypothetical protein